MFGQLFFESFGLRPSYLRGCRFPGSDTVFRSCSCTPTRPELYCSVELEFLTGVVWYSELPQVSSGKLRRHGENLLFSNLKSVAAINEICYFLLFGNSLRKVLNLFFFKTKICSPTKNLSNHELLSIFLCSFFEGFSCSFSVFVKILCHTFLYFLGRRDLFSFC